MKRIVMFSGGKDSSVLVHWMIEQGYDFETVFCNTGWELPETLKFIRDFAQLYLDGKITELKSSKYDSMRDMIIKKDYIPTVHQRFCTQELKVQPLYDYIKKFKDKVHLYNGVRRAESTSRQNAIADFYDKDAKCWVHRPLIDWSDEDIFEYMNKHEIIINPLYKKGMKRVGCGPCILISLKELAVLKEIHPERIDEIREIEKSTKQTFFFSKMIPERFRMGKSSKGNKRATIDDVCRYLDQKAKYKELSEAAGESCMSYYGLCE